MSAKKFADKYQKYRMATNAVTSQRMRFWLLGKRRLWHRVDLIRDFFFMSHVANFFFFSGGRALFLSMPPARCRAADEAGCWPVIDWAALRKEVNISHSSWQVQYIRRLKTVLVLSVWVNLQSRTLTFTLTTSQPACHSVILDNRCDKFYIR